LTQPIDAFLLHFLVDEVVNGEQRVVAIGGIERLAVGFVQGRGEMVFELPAVEIEPGKSSGLYRWAWRVASARCVAVESEETLSTAFHVMTIDMATNIAFSLPVPDNANVFLRLEELLVTAIFAPGL